MSKIIVQVVRHSDGNRSNAVSGSRGEIAARIQALSCVDESGVSPICGEDFVLVLLEDVGTDSQRFSNAPMMTVSSFMNQFHLVEEVSND